MSGSRHFDRIAAVVTALILVITLLFMNGASLGIQAKAVTMGYENRLFDQEKVHTIDIVMEDWEDMIANAASEEYYMASVVIDGEAYKNVGIRTKGNTSLSTVSTLGSQRYSFKIEFDHYDSGKSYYGLDKLSLNNLIQDSTMMKDYLTYTMMQEFGVHASLCSYVYITVNGQEWGLYLAVEGVEESFLERNYGRSYGQLYKPDSLSFGGGDMGSRDMGDFDFDFDFDFDGGSSGGESPDSQDTSGEVNFLSSTGGGMPDTSSSSGGEMPGNSSSGGGELPQGTVDTPGNFDPMDGGNGGMNFGGGMGSNDVKLQYIDDDLSSYSNIWNNAKTEITEDDQNRLIQSLKKLGNNQEISSVVDVEQVMRYFVVHNYVCNGDSYTGSMIHNYYLYEENGKLAMIPWDYNLAFGTFQGGNGNTTVNTPIDAPVENGSGEDRPMWNWILTDEDYTQLYHQYFAEFLDTVDVDAMIDGAYDLIKDYVAKDPTAFYTPEEFEAGVETMRAFCQFRSESISLQLENGDTTSGKQYVNAAGITLSDMGSMGGGMGGGGDMPTMPGNQGEFTGSMPGGNNDQLPTAGEGMEMPQGGFAARPEGNAAGNLPDAGTENPAEGGDFPNQPSGTDENNFQNPSSGGGEGNSQDPSSGGGESNLPNQPGGNGSLNLPTDNGGDGESEGNPSTNGNPMHPQGTGDMGNNQMQTSGITPWIWIVGSLAVLGIGLTVAKVYRV